MSTLRVQSLAHQFPGRSPWLSDWSATFTPGVHLIEGGDGSGKSSLIRLLAGTLLPTAGQLHLDGQDAVAASQAYRSDVFWCDPQSDRLDGLGARDYLAHHRAAHSTWCDDDLLADLDRFGLTPHLDKPLYALSAGTRRKLRLAAALASGAALTLMDDPLAALDRRSIAVLCEALAEFSVCAVAPEESVDLPTTVPHRIIVLTHPSGPEDFEGVIFASHRILPPR